MESDLKKAIQTLVEALKEDNKEGSYYYAWQSNIAMAFYDEWHKQAEERSFTDLGKMSISDIANTAAKNFLDSLINA